MNYVTFSIILDDIVFPIGETRMGVLGGGGPQTAFGMRMWSDSVGIVAGVGSEFPTEAQGWFEQSGIDLTGVRRTTEPTPRAWQLLERDGSRTMVWRVPGSAIQSHLSRSIEQIPDSYRTACGFHLGVHPEQPDLGFIRRLRQLGGIVSIEPFKPADIPLTANSLGHLLSAADIFSPNLVEAVSLVGAGEPEKLVQRLFKLGAKVVALRMGPDGALVAERETGRAVRIPALPVRLVDPVGAGNAFCGGFLVGWVETGDLETAGLYGTVAASFLLEHIGVPACTDAIRAESQQRLEISPPADAVIHLGKPGLARNRGLTVCGLAARTECLIATSLHLINPLPLNAEYFTSNCKALPAS